MLRNRSRAAIVAAAILLLGSCLPLTLAVTPAAGADVGSLLGQISSGQSQVSQLSGTVQASGAQLARIHGSIASLQRQIDTIQAQLNDDRRRLLALRIQLTLARNKLAQLEAFQARAERVLSTQLVASYENDKPDLISVVLEAHGFNDLLERLAFAKRIRNQDVQITLRVRAARAAVAQQAIALGGLELRQQRLADEVLRSRNRLDQTRIVMVRQELQVASQHAAQARRLGAARAHLSDLRGQLAQAQAAAAAAAAQATQNPSGASTGSVPAASAGGPAGSSGGFTFPLPKASVSPPGTWTEDQGVDMAAPGDTPEYAVCSGTIVQHGIGGFGPWAPVLHCDSSIGGYDYVYYGHAGPQGQVPIGTHVSAGEVMSSIGPGIVGISTGPHIEIGFAGSDGAPVGGSSASTMMSLLQSSY